MLSRSSSARSADRDRPRGALRPKHGVAGSRRTTASWTKLRSGRRAPDAHLCTGTRPCSTATATSGGSVAPYEESGSLVTNHPPPEAFRFDRVKDLLDPGGVRLKRPTRVASAASRADRLRTPSLAKEERRRLRSRALHGHRGRDPAGVLGRGAKNHHFCGCMREEPFEVVAAEPCSRVVAGGDDDAVEALTVE